MQCRLISQISLLPLLYKTGLFSKRPSLNHLREIGCHAFSLIQTSNPKVFACSRPCILIGYAPQSKAYRLWDPSNGKIFNSFHVTFIEHLDEQPADLLPGTTVSLSPDAPATWDVAAVPSTPRSILPTPCVPSHPPIIPLPIPPVQSPSLITSHNTPNLSSDHFPPHPPTANAPIPSTNNTVNINNNTNNNTVDTNNNTVNTNAINSENDTNDTNDTIDTNSNINANTPNLTILRSNLQSNIPLRRSSRTRLSSVQHATNDGLLPDSHLASAISDSAVSTARARAACSTRLPSIPEAHVSTFIDDLSPDDFTHCFLSEFSDFRQTHDLLPLDIPHDYSFPLDVFLSDVETSSLEPTAETDDDPSWKEALASPQCEYWIAGVLRSWALGPIFLLFFHLSF